MTTTPVPLKRYLTIKDLMSMLNISRSTAQRLLSEKKIRTIKLGSHAYRIDPDTLAEDLRRLA